MSSSLKFEKRLITNTTNLAHEFRFDIHHQRHDVNLKERLKVLIVPQTRLFDCLVGYFYLSGFHLLYPALEGTEKIRILIGLKTDERTFDLLETAKNKVLCNLSLTLTLEQFRCQCTG